MVPRSGYNDQLVDDAALELGRHHFDDVEEPKHENMILGQFNMGEHQAKCRSLVTIDQLRDDATLDLGCHHLGLRHAWYQQYRHYRPHALTHGTDAFGQLLQ